MSAPLPPPASGASTTGLEPHIAAALAYLAGPLSGILLLVAERAHPDVRFHAWQSIVGLGAIWALGMVLYVLAFAALFVSATGFRVLLWLAVLVWVCWIAVWILCLVKAYGGGRWKLPLAGEWARKLATPNS